MATYTIREEKKTTVAGEEAHVMTGSAAAAMISGGIGTLFIGLMTTGAAMSEGLKEALNWWNPAGPLVGKTLIGVFAWLISWFIMNRLWQNKESDLNKAFTITLVLIGLGVLLTFPPIFVALEG